MRAVVKVYVEVDGPFDPNATKRAVEQVLAHVKGVRGILHVEAHTAERRAKKKVLGRFKSRSDPTAPEYEVCERLDGTLYCGCRGYRWSGGCWHIEHIQAVAPATALATP